MGHIGLSLSHYDNKISALCGVLLIVWFPLMAMLIPSRRIHEVSLGQRKSKFSLKGLTKYT
jgi:hypothetical protein